MQYLWSIKQAYLKDIVEQYPEPRPAYTTISTVVNVLVRKGFIDFTVHGKSRLYKARISKDKYTKQTFNGLMDSFFDNSTKQFASFLTQKSELTVEQLKEIRALIDEQIRNQK